MMAPIDRPVYSGSAVTGGTNWSRRSVLAGSAAALLACAACGSNSAGTSPSSTAQQPVGTAAGGSTAALGKVADIPVGSGLVAVGAGGPVLLADSGGGKVVAHTAVCTHQGATLNGAGICPLHGSKFDVTTGAVLAGPATAPLAAVAVKITDGQVFLA